MPDDLIAANPTFYDSREKAERIAAEYWGWTPENDQRFSRYVLGVEYPMDNHYHIDGVSEWQCLHCNARIGRFSGRILQKGEYEKLDNAKS